jgi:CRP/FNR family cyclic AMP-dependent transcriptional regulator
MTPLRLENPKPEVSPEAFPEVLIDPLTYLSYSATTKYRPGQQIYVQGEPPRAMYLVLHGNVILTQRLLTIYQAGDFFGEKCLLSGCTNRETAVAFDETTLMTWTAQEIQKMCDDSPQLALCLMQRQVLRSMDLVTRIESLSSDTLERRLIRALLAFCDCFGEADGAGWVRLKTISQKMLAECTGVSRQRVRTVMSSLRDRRLLYLSWGAMRVHVAEMAKCIPEGGVAQWTPPVKFFALN